VGEIIEFKLSGGRKSRITPLRGQAEIIYIDPDERMQAASENPELQAFWEQKVTTSTDQFFGKTWDEAEEEMTDYIRRKYRLSQEQTREVMKEEHLFAKQEYGQSMGQIR
jgi:hypothetical protein